MAILQHPRINVFHDILGNDNINVIEREARTLKPYSSHLEAIQAPYLIFILRTPRKETDFRNFI